MNRGAARSIQPAQRAVDCPARSTAAPASRRRPAASPPVAPPIGAECARHLARLESVGHARRIRYPSAPSSRRAAPGISTGRLLQRGGHVVVPDRRRRPPRRSRCRRASRDCRSRPRRRSPGRGVKPANQASLKSWRGAGLAGDRTVQPLAGRRTPVPRCTTPCIMVTSWKTLCGSAICGRWSVQRGRGGRIVAARSRCRRAPDDMALAVLHAVDQRRDRPAGPPRRSSHRRRPRAAPWYRPRPARRQHLRHVVDVMPNAIAVFATASMPTRWATRSVTRFSDCSSATRSATGPLKSSSRNCAAANGPPRRVDARQRRVQEPLARRDALSPAPSDRRTA